MRALNRIIRNQGLQLLTNELAMDDYSWLLHDGGDDMRGCAASCAAELRQEAIGSQPMQHQLDQIYMLLDMEKHADGHGVPEPPRRHANCPSSSSSSFSSFSGNPDENSSAVLTAASATSSSHRQHHQLPEFSSHIPLSPINYGDGSILDMMTTLDTISYQEAHQELAGASVFRPYTRFLGPRKKAKPGACGQRAIKSVMFIVERMHMARLAQCYQMRMASPAQDSLSTPAASSVNQLQHVLTERKRREKLNDSFKALKSVLPPASKKDKVSILIRARDYVNTLKSRVSQLEEKNRLLVESQLHCVGDDGKQDGSSEERIEIEISRTPVERTLECQELQLKIMLPSGCSVMDAAAGILQCLNERGDVKLVAMNTGSSSTGGPSEANYSSRSTIALQLKSSSCDEEILKESILKAVKNVMQSGKATS